MIIVPQIHDKDVRKIIKKLNASHNPAYLDVTPEPDAQVKDCFIVVQEKIKQFGGRMILGWQIWKNKYLIEAECHAVWEDNDELLNDITPKEFYIDKILFIEDENLIYQDKQIDNIRLNITNNKLVDDLISICEALFRFDNKGERASLFDLSKILTEGEIQHKEYLLKLKDYVNFILSKNGNNNSLCPCQNINKFKDCHGKDFKKRIQKDI